MANNQGATGDQGATDNTREQGFEKAVGEVLRLGCDANHRPDDKRFNTALALLQRSVRKFEFAVRNPVVLAARDVVDKSWRLNEKLAKASIGSWLDFVVGINRLRATAVDRREQALA